MTRYYLYIKSGVILNEDTRFYKLAIGEGCLGDRVKTWLEAYAHEHGHFFVLWSSSAADFYIKCRDSIGSKAADIIVLSGRDFVRSLKNGCEDPETLEACRNRHRLLMAISPDYFYSYQLSRDGR